MTTSPRLPSGVRRLLRLPVSRARMLREMDEEVLTHLAMRILDLQALGWSEQDARAEALRRFGDSAEYREYAERRVTREARRHRLAQWFGEWTRDVRFAGRQFGGRNTGFTLLAVLTLALAIGANTAIFSVVHRLLIAPLPYADGNRIVRIVLTDGTNSTGPGPALLAWSKRARSLETIAAVSVDAMYLQDFGDAPDSVSGFITSNYLTLLGIQPAIGRDFTEADERPDAAPVAMISYRKWMREFAGSATVLGATVRAPDVDERLYTIVGVTPPEMSVPMSPGQGVNHDLRQAAPGIWLPRSLEAFSDPHVFARLRSGVSASDASRELQAVLESEAAPRSVGGTFSTGSPLRARAMRAQDFLDPRETQTVRVLFASVGVLLLIACANVANLLMSRAWNRRREFAVRTAMGAGRARLTRQVLTESVLLAFGGGIAGVGVAWLTLEVILALRPVTLEELGSVQLEPAVLLWSAAISVITGVLFGCAPAFFAASQPAGDVLRNDTRAASGSAAARRVRSALTVLEIAMSLVLLVNAGLLVRSFVALQRMPLNFASHGLVAADVMMMLPRDLAARVARRGELLERLRAIPGVTEASFGMMPGLGWRAFGLETESADGDGGSVDEYSVTFISPNYFRVAGIRLVQGRVPGLTETAAPAQEIAVNRTLARRLWPDGRAIGARLHDRSPRSGMSYVVVGVVDDIQIPGRRSAMGPADIYQSPPPRFAGVPVLLRTSLPERDIVESIRRVVQEYDRGLRGGATLPYRAVLRSITVGDDYLAESLAPTRFAMGLLVAFALLALVLSGVGLYGVIGYSVSQRTREIGVRVALGADTRSVAGLILGDGLRLTALGLVLGIAGASATTRLLASLLYGVGPMDPLSFTAIAVIVLVIAVAASWVPARRAMLIDPMEALRAD